MSDLLLEFTALACEPKRLYLSWLRFINHNLFGTSRYAFLMSMTVPTKQDCYYIIEMVDSELIDFSFIHPWADNLIVRLNSLPAWLGDLALKKYKGDVLKAFGSYVYSEPFEEQPEGMEKFHVACLWLRYERGELSWATFLRVAGDKLDNASADWDCETPYHYLNLHEDANFSKESEANTRSAYLKDHDLGPWIALAREKFEPFSHRRIKKARGAD